MYSENWRAGVQKSRTTRIKLIPLNIYSICLPTRTQSDLNGLKSSYSKVEILICGYLLEIAHGHGGRFWNSGLQLKITFSTLLEMVSKPLSYDYWLPMSPILPFRLLWGKVNLWLWSRQERIVADIIEEKKVYRRYAIQTAMFLTKLLEWFITQLCSPL